MRWWLDRGVDGFRMDVINMISKDPLLPDGRGQAGARVRRRREHFLCGPRIHEYLAEMHAFAGREGDYLTVGEMPGVTVDEARRAEIDMVFQFEHVSLDQGSHKGASSPAGCWTSRPAWGAGRPAWPRRAGTASTGTTTTSHGWSPASATTPPSSASSPR
jgi:glycosidase